MYLLRHICKRKIIVQQFMKPNYLFNNYQVVRSLSWNSEILSQTNETAIPDEIRQKLEKADVIFLKQMSKFLKDVDSNGKMSSNEAIFLLRNCGDKMALEEYDIRIAMTKTVWDSINKYEVPLDVSHFNSLLQAHIENKSKITHAEFLQLMKNNNICPNRLTYSKLILLYCLHGNIEGANSILEIMKEEKHAIDETIFNSLILGNSRAHNLDGALQVVNIMKQKGMLFESGTYDCLVEMYAEHNKLEECESIIVDANKQDTFISPKSLMEAYALFRIHKNHDAANKIRSLLHFGQSARTITPLLQKLVKAGEYEAAYGIVLYAPFHFNIYYFFLKMLTIYANLATTLEYSSRLFDMYGKMEPFGNVIECYSKQNNIGNALHVLSYMRKNQILIDSSILYRIIMRMDPDLRKSQGDLFRVLQYDGPNSVHLYRQIFVKFNIEDPLLFLNVLKEKLGPNHNRFLGCFLNILFNSSFKEGVEFAKSAGGFTKCFSWLFNEIGKIFRENSNCIDEAVEIILMIDHYLKYNIRVEHRNLKLTDLINSIDFNLAAINLPNKEDVMFKLFKRMNDYGFYLPKVDYELLTVQCSCLTSESEEELLKMVDGVPNSLYQEFIQSVKINRKEDDMKINLNMASSILLQKFDYLFAKGLYDEAIILYKGMDSPNITLSLKIAGIYNEQSNYKELVEIYSSIFSKKNIVPLEDYWYYVFSKGLIYEGRLEDAVNIIKISQNLQINETYISAIYSLSVADQDIIRDVLLQKHLITGVVEIKLGIAYDIKRNNLEEALQTIKHNYNELHHIPFKLEFYMKCFETGQTETLNKFHEYLKSKFGQSYAVHFKVFSLLLMKKLKEAEQELQIIGDTINTNFFQKLLKSVTRECKLELYENLLKITKDICSNDRAVLYVKIIKLAMNANDSTKALEYWINMQEENLQLPDDFSSKFAYFLLKNGENVPFVYNSDDVPSAADNLYNITDMKTPEFIISKLRDSDGPVKMKDFFKEIIYPIRISDPIIIQYIEKNINADNAIEILNLTQQTTKLIPLYIMNLVYSTLKESGQIEGYLNAVLNLDSEIYSHPNHSRNILKGLFSPEILTTVQESKKYLNDLDIKSALWNYYMLTEQQDKANLEFNDIKRYEHFTMDYKVWEKFNSESNLETLHGYLYNLKNKTTRIRSIYLFTLWRSKYLYKQGFTKEAYKCMEDVKSELPTENYSILNRKLSRFYHSYNMSREPSIN